MLEVNQLTRSYGDLKAVDDVSFKIGKGEIVGLLGHNGAGKTTIMKMISGYLEPNNGTVCVDDIALSDHPKMVQLSLGYLPENLPIYSDMTVAEYLEYAADLKGLTNQSKQKEIKKAIIDTDISQKLLSPISTLSRGFKQRVGVAQAILGQPKLLILDEPTNGLDPEQTQHMRELIREISKNATVILSTHIMQEVDALCTRVLMLRSGKLAVDENLIDLRSSDQIFLQTSMPELNALKLADLDEIKAVKFLQQENNYEDELTIFSYQITLNSATKQKKISANLASNIMIEKYELYSIHTIQRDLETLFKEVNEEDHLQGELNNAA